MKRGIKKTVAIGCCALLLFSGCSNVTATTTTDTTMAVSDTVETSTEADTETQTTDSSTEEQTDTESMFTDRDKEIGYDEDACVHIQLSDHASSCDSFLVTIENQTVTITEEGTYLLSGSLSDGMVIVDTDENAKVQLILDGVTINHSSCAAIYVKTADKVFITLAPDTENVLSNGGTYEAIDDNNIDGVIFSKSDLTLNGTGALSVQAKAGHGVVSKDDLVITSGNYTVVSEKQGLTGKDSLRILDGNFTVTSGKDALHSENTDNIEEGFIYIAGGSFNLTASDDGLDASGDITINGGTWTIDAGDDGMHADGQMTVNDGDITISESYEGIEGNDVIIAGGQIDLEASDDGLNGQASILISGGHTEINAEGDGMDSNGTLTVSGGETYISGPIGDGDGAMDYETEATITGGILVAVGSSGMAVNFGNASTQGSILLDTGDQEAGTSIVLTDASGNELLSWETFKRYASVVVSSPEIVEGETYTVQAGTFEETVTMDNLIYGTGHMMGNGGGPGRDGMNGNDPGPGMMRNNNAKPEKNK